ASDVLVMIWRKNDTYMAVGSISLSAGWVTLYSLTLVIVCTVVYSITQGLHIAALMLSMASSVLQCSVWNVYSEPSRRSLTSPFPFLHSGGKSVSLPRRARSGQYPGSGYMPTLPARP